MAKSPNDKIRHKLEIEHLKNRIKSRISYREYGGIFNEDLADHAPANDFD